MAQFRVESVLDNDTGLYYVEIYQETKDKPFAVGKPIYSCHEHAMADSVEILKTALPNQPITAWREK